MIFYWLAITLLMIYFISPFFFIDLLHNISLVSTNLLTIISPFLQAQSTANSSIFDTVAQVLAAFMAIVFTISLFVIQMSADKYTPKIKKYFKENLWTNRAFSLGLITILICVLFLVTNVNNLAAMGIVFFLLILNSLFFYFYYNRMIKIINPYEIADLLKEECLNSVINHNIKDVKEILATLSDVIIKAVKANDEALTIKYTQTLIKIYYDLQDGKYSKKIRIEIETILFNEIFRALQLAITTKDPYRKYLIQIFFDAIQHEASKKEFVDENEIDLIISTMLFNCNRYAVENNDFELFKRGLHNISMSLVSSPRSIQNEMHSTLIQNVPKILIYKTENSEIIFKEINCFVHLLNCLTIKEFSSIKILITILELYEKNLEKNLDTIVQSEEKINKLMKIFGTNREDLLSRIEIEINSLIGGDKFDYFSKYKQLDLLLISLKIHFVYYHLGAFIIFEGKQGRINSATYLKELWDHTRPDDVDGIILNESPVLFDPLWLTYIHFYGGQNVEYWTKTSFGFSWGYDDYHGAEDYLYQYYLLTITRCIQKGNSKLDLPLIEELDNLKATEYYKLSEWYEFTRIFETESKFLLDHCEQMINSANRWDLLFNNNANEALIITKAWIQAYASYCKKLHEEIIKRLNTDPKKIDKFSKLVIEEYRNVSIIDKLTDILSFDEERDKDLTFITIYQNIGNLQKDWFLKENYTDTDQIFTEIGRRIAFGEKQHVLETILSEKSIDTVTITNLNLSSLFNDIKNQVNNMKRDGQLPSIVFIPLEIMKDFVIAKMASTFSAIKIDDMTKLEVLTSNKFWPFKEIVILDKSAGIWTYKPINENNNRLFVEISSNESNELLMKILAKTTINYRIVNSKSAKILNLNQLGN